jgi:peptidoglycan/LPS O-acetylase OafA/YrhL
LLLTGELPLHARLLETRWLCFVGKNTYGIYLLHNVAIRELDRLVPLVWFMRYTGSLFLAVLAHVLAELLLAVTVAAIIREVYEKQFLRLNRYFPRRPIVLATGPAP